MLHHAFHGSDCKRFRIIGGLVLSLDYHFVVPYATGLNRAIRQKRNIVGSRPKILAQQIRCATFELQNSCRASIYTVLASVAQAHRVWWLSTSKSTTSLKLNARRCSCHLPQGPMQSDIWVPGVRSGTYASDCPDVEICDPVFEPLVELGCNAF